jgi:hypothetical protein
MIRVCPIAYLLVMGSIIDDVCHQDRQKISDTHFKKAPGTHKLGVLYVVDSVTRQWVEAARKAGQISSITPGPMR